ncbi:MAG: ethanolamine ammonia-lyase reactivating factor EutA [Desulfobacteraceae bacterium]|nr:ethanolamine ammonia-lyase reactivating factor EutA [Desulfobacteraceae bacterium]
MKETVLSVGIDIGTSTTQLVFSQISLENMASMVSVPRIKIVDKEVVYRSDIHFTPLVSKIEIDARAVRTIVEQEYAKAGIIPDQVQTGAVIITGETARKQNASDVLSMLSGLAGEFVVATAGPSLEGIIAGKGANAQEESKKRGATIANLDIGGGTTNIAVFNNGEVIDTACLDIGGRLIRFAEGTGKVAYCSDKMGLLTRSMGLDADPGTPLSVEAIEAISGRMAGILEEVVGVTPATGELATMVTDKDLKRDYSIDYITFSGGVADCISTNRDGNDFEYGDLGRFLGRAIANSRILKEKQVLESAETIRATVVGAGSHTTDISGSTITFNNDALPVQNIPILKLSGEDEAQPLDTWGKIIAEKVEWFRLKEEHQTPALALKGFDDISFEGIQLLARAIIDGMASIINDEAPLIVVVECDLAKVLGQTLKAQLDFKKDVICIDTVKVENGDYIDIGQGLAGGKVVPVIVKTLLFGY